MWLFPILYVSVCLSLLLLSYLPLCMFVCSLYLSPHLSSQTPLHLWLSFMLLSFWFCVCLCDYICLSLSLALCFVPSVYFSLPFLSSPLLLIFFLLFCSCSFVFLLASLLLSSLLPFPQIEHSKRLKQVFVWIKLRKPTMLFWPHYFISASPQNQQDPRGKNQGVSVLSSLWGGHSHDPFQLWNSFTFAQVIRGSLTQTHPGQRILSLVVQHDLQYTFRHTWKMRFHSYTEMSTGPNGFHHFAKINVMFLQWLYLQRCNLKERRSLYNGVLEFIKM